MLESLVITYIVLMVWFATVKLEGYIIDLEHSLRVKHIVMGLVFLPLTLVLTSLASVILFGEFIVKKLKSEKLNKFWNKKLKEMD